MILQLRVRVAQKVILEVSARVESILEDRMNVSEEEPTIVVAVPALIIVLFDKTESNELSELSFVLPDDLVGLLFFGNRIVIKSRCDQDSSLPYRVIILLHSLKVINNYLITC